MKVPLDNQKAKEREGNPADNPHDDINLLMADQHIGGMVDKHAGQRDAFKTKGSQDAALSEF
jgi:hypothetical protein